MARRDLGAAARIDALGPAPITAATADGGEPLRAAIDAVRADPTVAAAWDGHRPDEAAAIVAATARLAARTVHAHATTAAAPPF